MAGRKEYELLMKLTAALDPNFKATFQKSNDTIKKMQDALQNLKKVQGDVSAYKKMQEAINKTKDRMKELEDKHKSLQQELSDTIQKEKDLREALENSAKKTGKQTDEYKQLQAEIKKTKEQKSKLAEQVKTTAYEIEKSNEKIVDQEEKLTDLSEKLKTAGINTGNLAAENGKLQEAYDRIKGSQENVARANKAIEENEEAIESIKEKLVETGGAIAGVGALFAIPIKGAMEFESSMAEVSKVVDWIGNGNTATAEQIKNYNELGDSLNKLTRKIPMSVSGLAEIAAAAGQAGVATDNESLIKFTSDAAKMGIAFDVSAEQAGSYMAQWRTAFKMTQDEVISLSDAINFLGNDSASDAAQISSVVTKIGPLGEVAGISSKEIAALGAAIVGTGINEDVAATGIKNLMLDMTKGTAATKAMHGVLKTLGTSATDLAERMQTDATGAILDFMQAVQKLPKAEQASALTTYFGQESVAAIAPLLSNLDELKNRFDQVGNSSIYAGSMEKEFIARSETSENELVLLKSALEELSRIFGNIFVPGAASAIDAITQIIYKVTDFVDKNPELIKTVVKVAASLAAMKVAALSAELGFQYISLGANTVQKSLALLSGGLGGAGTVIGSFLSKLGPISGILGKIVPFIGIFGKIVPIIGIISGLSMLFLKLNGRDVSGFMKPLQEAFEVAKPTLEGLMKQLTLLGQKLMPNLIGAAKALMPVFAEIIAAILPVIVSLLQALMPIISSFAEKVLPIILGVIEKLMPLFSEIITTILPIIKNLIDQLIPIIGVWAEVFMTGFGGVIQSVADSITPIIEGVKDVFNGLLEFITNIFSGKWEEAWNGIKGILEGIVGTFKAVVLAPFRYIAGIINTFIDGLNKIKIPDWVPGVGGKNINIPKIPNFEKGSNFTPDTFIAGDVNGKGGELITGAQGRKVFTAAETSEILKNINAAKAINSSLPTMPQAPNSDAARKPTEAGNLSEILKNINTAKSINSSLPAMPQVPDYNAARIATKAGQLNRFAYTNDAPRPLPPELPEIRSGGTQNFTINYNPTIQVNGDRPGDLEEKLKQNNKELLEQFKAFLRKRDEDERRMRYA